VDLLRRAVAPALCVLALAPGVAVARTIVGTPGKDRLVGGPREAHVINGDGGGDRIFGGPFNDRLLGEWGGDDVYGDAGNDYIDGGSGGDLLVGDAGADWIVGGFGGDRIRGGADNDLIDGGSAGDTIDGGTGDDIIQGGSATDVINGGPGNDQLHSTSSGDHIKGEDGSDTVWVNNGSAAREVDCGPGRDVLHINPYDQRGGIHDRRSVRSGRFRNCETILETPRTKDPTKGRKKLTRDRGGRAKGTDRNDTLLGSYGPDRLIGLGGNDVIWANRQPTGRSRGTDRIEAGSGDDTVYGASRGGRSIISGGTGNDYLQGGGVTSTNFISGGAGLDVIRLVGHGYNRVNAGNDDDIVYVYSKDRAVVDCGDGRDTVRLGNNRNVVFRNCEKKVRL
jgi:Ca2+-binding RTX toxin-like protein